MNISFYSEGAAQEVTGSKHILEIDGERCLIDCGAFQGRRQETYAKNKKLVKNPATLAAVVLSHAHYDHCGLLPLLSKRGYEGNYYATSATRDLASVVLMDSASIQARDSDYAKKQAKKNHENEDSILQPLFDEQDVVKAMNQFVTLSYRRKIALTEKLAVEFFDAGHILGSAISRFTIAEHKVEKMTIAFTGDLGRPNKPIICDPSPIPPVDYLVIESTYGDRLHDDAQSVDQKLADIITATYERGGKIVIPAFALERTQELIYHLHLLVEQKGIPKMPIYLDSPMAINATNIFKIHPECYDERTKKAFLDHHENPFGFNDLHFVNSVEESKRLNDLQGPAIIISADGMCEAGRVRHHISNTISDSRNTILTVGYMAENTLGRRLVDGASEVRIGQNIYKVQAHVESINALSAHADYEEAWSWMKHLDLARLKKVFLVHGEDSALNHFKQFLLGKNVKAVQIVKYGERYSL